MDKYYTTGEFMKLTHTTKKTLRYYNEHDILKPAKVTEEGYRLYTDKELAQMQQILLLKYLGFSLSDIREITINNNDMKFIADSLHLQRKLVQDRIEQLQLVVSAIQKTTDTIEHGKQVDWSQMRELVELTGMENSLKKQYRNASNISSRIHLHSLYSKNRQGWFFWAYEQCELHDGMKILEVGCGDGSFWTKNFSRIPATCEIILTDVSQGMIRDASRNVRDISKEKKERPSFDFRVCSCEQLPFEKETFDLVIANHVLFYCDDIKKACSEISRVLKPDGRLVCSTYGNAHMKEISELVSEFDRRIVLSAHKLYEHFGKENGEKILHDEFQNTEWRQYKDSLLVTDAEPLISYVMSCHGNQNRFLVERYQDFRSFVKKQIGEDGFYITKDAGVFICEKSA